MRLGHTGIDHPSVQLSIQDMRFKKNVKKEWTETIEKQQCISAQKQIPVPRGSMLHMMMMPFSSLARTLRDGLTIHSLPELF